MVSSLREALVGGRSFLERRGLGLWETRDSYKRRSGAMGWVFGVFYGCHGFSFLSVLVVAGAWTDGKESAPLSHLFLVPSWCCRGDGGGWYGMAFGGLGCQIKEEHGGGGCCHMGVANQK
jgi:hypothetical protein